MNKIFNLKNDLIFIDIEATGLNVVRDRIVQIAMLKYPRQDSQPKEFVQMINPGIPISMEAIAVHGITAQDLSNKPVFSQVAHKIFEFIGNADFAGYNLHRLDIPLLMEEFSRVGIDFVIDGRKFVDVQRIFYRMEPRDLKSAYKYYCDQVMDNNHDALVDARVTAEVLRGQLTMYRDSDYVDSDGNRIEKPIRPDVEALHDFTMDKRNVEPTQKLRYDLDGTIVFNFGRYIGQPAGKVLYEDRQYYNWMLNKEFSNQVKQIIKRLLREYEDGLGS